LRQELDSMIRAIYLLTISNISEREKLIIKTLTGEKWKRINKNGKNESITDKNMVEIADSLNGWTLSVYKFGCSFIHLSEFHNYNSVNPFSLLSEAEKKDIVSHINNYHCASLNSNSSLEDIIPYLPGVMEKIRSNLGCYLDDLKKGNKIEL